MRPTKSALFILFGTLILIVFVALPAGRTLAAVQSAHPAIVAAQPTPAVIIHLPIVTKNGDTSLVMPAGPNCRYGAVTLNSSQSDWLTALGAGWFLDFTAAANRAPRNVEAAHVVGLNQNKSGCQYLDGYTVFPSLTDAGLGALVQANRDALWIIGNEPDRGPQPGECTGGQSDIYPEMYARAYHDIYQFIKARDPSARVAIAGLVEVTPGRLQYLDKVWQAYLQAYGSPIPVDVWNMHLYILPETMPDGLPNGTANVALGTDPALGMRESGGDPAQCGKPNVYCYADHDNLTIFAQQVVAMRAWMQAHGQQARPLILSEYSLLYYFEDYDDPINPTMCYLMDEYGKCFTQPRVVQFMQKAFNYLETAADPALGYPLDHNRLVQQWMWFSANYDGAGNVSNLLVTSSGPLSQPGRTFNAAVLSRPQSVNLLPEQAGDFTGAIAAPSHTVTVPVTVRVRNNGNTATNAPFTVTLYADSALQQPVASATVQPPLWGCATDAVDVTLNWTGLTSGDHPYWLKVNSTQSVAESDPNDNITSGTIHVNAQALLVPVLYR